MPLINSSNIVVNFWERQEWNPGPLGERQECYLCAMQPPGNLYCFGLKLSQQQQRTWQSTRPDLYTKTVQRIDIFKPVSFPHRTFWTKLDLAWCTVRPTATRAEGINLILFYSLQPLTGFEPLLIALLFKHLVYSNRLSMKSICEVISWIFECLMWWRVMSTLWVYWNLIINIAQARRADLRSFGFR